VAHPFTTSKPLDTMTYPLLASFRARDDLKFPGTPYTAATRHDSQGRTSLVDTVVTGQRLLLGSERIRETPTVTPTVSQWKALFTFDDFDPVILDIEDTITWESTGEEIEVQEMTAIHQMVIDLASSNPSLLFEHDWKEGDNQPVVCPDGTAWAAAVELLGTLYTNFAAALSPHSTLTSASLTATLNGSESNIVYEVAPLNGPEPSDQKKLSGTYERKVVSHQDVRVYTDSKKWVKAVMDNGKVAKNKRKSSDISDNDEAAGDSSKRPSTKGIRGVVKIDKWCRGSQRLF